MRSLLTNKMRRTKERSQVIQRRLVYVVPLKEVQSDGRKGDETRIGNKTRELKGGVRSDNSQTQNT